MEKIANKKILASNKANKLFSLFNGKKEYPEKNEKILSISKKPCISSEVSYNATGLYILISNPILI